MTCVCHTVVWIAIVAISEVISQDKTRSSILDSKPIRVQDYGSPPATSTISLYDCSSSHRPNVDNPGAFEVYHDRHWYVQACQDGLAWNQTMCRCEFPNGNRQVVQCGDYRPTSNEPTGKYEQLVNSQWIVRDCSLGVAGLVWSQEACQCVWGPGSKEMITGQAIAPCEIMLNMTFENGVKDDAKGSFVEVGRGNPVPVFPINKRQSVDGYKAAYFTDTALNIWYFAGNELGTSLRVEFRFKMTNDPVQRDKYQIFMSNGCNVSSPGYNTPSLAIGYRAADQSYLLAFETVTARKAIVCTRKLGAYDWHTVSMIYEDGTLLFRVDDNPCIISQDFSGPIQKTPCPLTIGADPLERESMYKGYLDNILIARYCRRFVDTDLNEITDTGKGPMPVETAPNVVDIGFQQGKWSDRESSLGKSSDRESSQGKAERSKQRGITITKYLPQFPSVTTSESEYHDKTNNGRAFVMSPRGLDKTADSGNSFPRSLNTNKNNNDYGHGQSLGQEQRGEYSRHDKRGGHGNGYGSSRKTSGLAPGYSKDDKSVVATDDSYSENAGDLKTGYGKSGDGGEMEDGDVGKTRRGGNDDDNFGKNYESENGRKISGRGSGKDEALTGPAYLEVYSENDEKKNDQTSHEKGGGYININSGKRHREIDEANNEFTSSNHNSRSGNTFVSTEKAISESEDASSTSQQPGNNNLKNRGQDNHFDNSQNIGGDDYEFENSRGKNSGYQNSGTSGYHNTHKSAGLSGRDSFNENGGGIDNSGSKVKYGHGNSGKTHGYFNNNNKLNYETVVDFPWPDKKEQFVQDRTGLKVDSISTDNEDESVDYFIPDKDVGGDSDNQDENREENNRTENLPTKDYTSGQNKNYQNGRNDEHENQQNKEMENRQNREYNIGENKQSLIGNNREYESGQNKEYPNAQNKGYYNRQTDQKIHQTNQNKEYQNGQSKNYGNGENKEYNNRQSHEYGRVEQRKRSENTGPFKRRENWQAYKSNIDSKQRARFSKDGNMPIRKDEHSVKFEGSDKLSFLVPPSTEVSAQTKATRLPTDSEISSYRKVVGDRPRKGNGNIESLHRQEEETIELRFVKVGSGKIDSNNDLKLDKQQSQVKDHLTKNTSLFPSTPRGIKPTSSGTTGNLVKGNRRFGSKKINWYDRTDSPLGSDERSFNSGKSRTEIGNSGKSRTEIGNSGKSRTEAGNSGKSRTEAGNSGKSRTEIGTLPAHQHGAGDSSKVIMESGVRDVTGAVEHNDKFNPARNGKSSPSSPDQGDTQYTSHHKGHTPKQTFPRQRGFGKAFATPSYRGYVIKQIDKNYKADYASSMDDMTEVNIANHSPGSLDGRTKSAKSEAYINSKTGPINKSSEESSEPTKTSLEDTSQNEKVSDSKPDAQIKDEDKLRSLVKTKTSVLPKLGDNPGFDDPSGSRLGMPVDVTKIKARVTSDQPSGATVGRTTVSSSPIASGRAITVEKDRV